jgi:hypothetical protein
VFLFASLASPKDYLDYPIQTLKVGSLGTHKALGLAKDKGARFLLASTSEVYGDPMVHPQKENYLGNVNPIGPRAVYDEAKRFKLSKDLSLYVLEQAWAIPRPIPYLYNMWWPWLKNYYGAHNAGLRVPCTSTFG